MAGPAEHAPFRIGGFVSLWLGTFEDENDLDDYFKSGFQSDFGLRIDPPKGPEYDVNREPKPIRDLLKPFSSSSAFIDAASEAAELMGWSQAKAAVVFYHFKYDSDLDRSTPDSPLQFVGVFPIKIS